MDPDGKWTSTRAVLLAAAGQNRWPPAGNYMAATGQDLMVADILKAEILYSKTENLYSAAVRVLSGESRGEEATCAARIGGGRCVRPLRPLNPAAAATSHPNAVVIILDGQPSESMEESAGNDDEPPSAIAIPTVLTFPEAPRIYTVVLT